MAEDKEVLAAAEEEEEEEDKVVAEEESEEGNASAMWLFEHCDQFVRVLKLRHLCLILQTLLSVY